MTNASAWNWKVLFLLTAAALAFFDLLSPQCHAVSDTLSPGEWISAGSNKSTLVSNGEIFALGFFNPGGNSSRWYLGIWYNNLPGKPVVWVANRAAPVEGTTTGVLTLTEDGRLVVSDGKVELWSTAIKNISSTSTPTARLMDNGNLVVVDGNGAYSWQSFEHPTDTLLPGMKIGANLRTGESINLTSWRTADDPSPGNYTVGIDVSGVPQLMLYENLKPVWRIGHWTGESWSNLPLTLSLKRVLNLSYSATKDEVSFMMEILDKNMLFASLILNQTVPNMIPRAFTLFGWMVFTSLGPSDACDYYKRCGANNICSGNNEASCSCMPGFTDGNNGLSQRGGKECTRNFQVDCQGGSNELKEVIGKKLPDTTKAAVFESISGLEECKVACLKNCSCTACASATFNGTGCMMWFGELDDIEAYSIALQNFYLRSGSLDSATETFWKKPIGIVVVVVIIVAGTLIVGFVSCFLLKPKKKIKESYHSVQLDTEDLDLPILDFNTVQNATNNFSEENKLGEGGFGPVYKGTLADGQVVAVKRLSRVSTQGLVQFKNEIHLIAKLQHRNLVKLLGCCVHDEERMLIYEYMPKKSLDLFLFGKCEGELHDWRTRYKVILGIARGLLYLHQDSRLRIIHRDLKAANVLLDNDMNPKVSDFGTARIFEGHETEDTNTRRVVGTYGYMSPEYAVNGIFSMKSDVFSFGILLLEIISGIKNKSVFYSDPQKSLVGLAWKLWNAGNALELVDGLIRPPLPEEEILRCIKIGLLCVQEEPENRPLMSSVILMLDGDVGLKTELKEPNYIKMRVPFTPTLSPETNSANVMSITMHEGR